MENYTCNRKLQDHKSVDITLICDYSVAIFLKRINGSSTSKQNANALPFVCNVEPIKIHVKLATLLIAWYL